MASIFNIFLLPFFFLSSFSLQHSHMCLKTDDSPYNTLCPNMHWIVLISRRHLSPCLDNFLLTIFSQLVLNRYALMIRFIDMLYWYALPIRFTYMLDNMLYQYALLICLYLTNTLYRYALPIRFTNTLYQYALPI